MAYFSTATEIIKLFLNYLLRKKMFQTTIYHATKPWKYLNKIRGRDLHNLTVFSFFLLLYNKKD